MSVVVAGAGRIRWNSTIETTYYPGLPAEKFQPYTSGPGIDVTAQWTVWKLTNGTWLPDTCSTNMGPARDIAAIKAAAPNNTSQYIAVAARNGVFLKRDDYAWVFLGVPTGVASDAAWSVALTTDGYLYAAFASNGTKGGVYRIPNIAAFPTVSGCELSVLDPPWELIGDPSDFLPPNVSLNDIFRFENPIYLTVHDPGQNSSNPEVLYVGMRGHVNAAGDEGGMPARQGLLRASIPPNTPAASVDWAHILYATSNGSTYTWFPTSFTPGWEAHTGPFVLFQPLVHSPTSNPPVGAPRVALQVGTRFHATTNAKEALPQNIVWNQRYTTPVGTDTWLTRGYNELVVHGIDFMSDGRVIYGTGDFGVFRSVDTANSAFEWLRPPLDDQSQCGYAMSNESLHAHPQQNWLGSGREWVLVSNGNVIHRTKPGRMFAFDGAEWYDMTCDLDAPDRDRYLFEDFIVVGGDIYVIYTKFDRTVGQDGALFVEAGILQGTKVHYPGSPDYLTPGD